MYHSNVYCMYKQFQQATSAIHTYMTVLTTTENILLVPTDATLVVMIVSVHFYVWDMKRIYYCFFPFT